MTKATDPRPGVLEAIRGRRSVRAYTAETLGGDTIRLLLDAAVHAPTAVRSEPWAFVIVQDPAVLRHLSDVAKGEWAREAARFGELHHGAELPAASEFLDALISRDFNIFYDASTLIVICARPAGPFAAADCWLAAQNLMLAAHALGLGSCCIGSAVPSLNTPTVKAELGIEPDITAVAPIIVGVPRVEPAPVPRKPPEILFWK